MHKEEAQTGSHMGPEQPCLHNHLKADVTSTCPGCIQVWVGTQIAQEETLSTQSTQTDQLCGQNTLTFSPGHSTTQVQAPGKVLAQVPSNRAQTPAAQWDPWRIHSKMDGETWTRVSTSSASPQEQRSSNSGVFENCLLSAWCLTFPPV